ncbi:MAG TPA: ankyrin repeat domain-containing protein [Candidatus Nitrosotenuis sp.]|nr:ankyrin repeat domain-containing protein [Candidatus Nitrosotenuis sp.]
MLKLTKEKKLFAIVCWALITLSNVNAFPPDQLPHLFHSYSQFHDADKHLSPLYGELALKSGILANIRFYGHYGPLKNNILCHYQITTPPGDISPTSDKDCPQDYTTSIIQQLFPSPTGGQLKLPGPDYDFFKIIPLGELGKLLKLYSDLKHAHVSTTKAFEQFQTLFKMWLLEAKSKGGLLNKDSRKSLSKLWDKSDRDILIKLAHHYATLFAGALSEIHQYPTNLVESGLLAFACQRSKTMGDLEPLVASLTHVQDPLSHPDFFSEEQYELWKQKALTDENKITPEAFNQLLNHPEWLIFVTLAYELYDSRYPLILGTERAIHTYQTPENSQMRIEFSDCGETSLRNFFNVLLAYPKSKTFKINLLQKSFPHVSPKLITFFETVQPTYRHVNNDIHGRSQWADVVSSLNQSEDTPQIIYGNSGRCNIKGIGIDNMVAVLANLLNDPELHKPISNDQHRGQIMTYILNKFSDNEVKFSWHSHGHSHSLTNFADITIQINGEDQFVWQFKEHHFEFKPIKGDADKDWRRNQPSLLISLLTSDLNSSLKRQLIPYYLGTKSYPLLLAPQNLKLSTTYGYELIYGSSFNGVEDVLQTLDFGLSINAHDITRLAPKWLNSLYDDQAINDMVISLIFKHSHIFSETEFTSKNYPRFYPLYLKILSQLKLKGLHKKLFNYLDNPFSDRLIIHALEGKASSDIAQLTNTKNQTLLHASCATNHLELTNFLLENHGESLLQPSFIKDQEGKTPFHLAAISGHKEVIDVLLKNPLSRSLLLHKKNLVDDDEITPFQWAVWNGHLTIVQSFLEDPEIRKLFLGPYLKTPYGDTPLHLVARKGKISLLKFFLKDQETRKILLESHNILNNGEETPLHSALEKGREKVVQIFLSDPALKKIFFSNNYLKNMDGLTPLHLAAQNGFKTILILLLTDREVRNILLNNHNWLTHDEQSPIDLTTNVEIQNILIRAKEEFDQRLSK